MATVLQERCENYRLKKDNATNVTNELETLLTFLCFYRKTISKIKMNTRFLSCNK